MFDFFDIKIQTYGNYLLWGVALALFNALLPYQKKNIFEDGAFNIIKKISEPTSAPAPAPKSSKISEMASILSATMPSATMPSASK
jgi:hypothetical protein